jgi:hypothetical protein
MSGSLQHNVNKHGRSTIIRGVAKKEMYLRVKY